MEHPLNQFVNCPKCGSSHFVNNNEKSKRCEDCKFVYYFNPSAATVAVILNSKNEILVALRAKDPAKNTLDLPGGFVDVDETGEEAVCREVKEETGLDVNNTQYLFSIPNIYIYSGFTVHTLDLFYLCYVKDTSYLLAQDDVAATRFIPIEEIEVEKFGLRSIREGIKRLLENKELLCYKQVK
ncbi:NUDIX hydrolase [Bacteroides coprosuis DSM 18011]|uniref:NUDIX hydrolase n=1 Tax=Bacteroides coprosuis DSM 18011 TaxID=679937 RepID=F3ZR61_9BACE|nr:NUDIX domain-containing protein [Bacteroides coprosuis]EGJ70654.1 NUDIX hydrolase [Bacteroides coprosuis DSM 18011]